MLTVKPDVNNDISEIKTLNAYTDGQPCGYARFKLNGYIIILTEILPLPADTAEIDNETFAVLDTLIRALGSWGLNHSCFYLECHDPMLYPTLGRLRFSQKDGAMKSTLREVLQSCGGH